ncbi:hypothetical protein FKM82_004205 [Ascaphus truei]
MKQQFPLKAYGVYSSQKQIRGISNYIFIRVKEYFLRLKHWLEPEKYGHFFSPFMCLQFFIVIIFSCCAGIQNYLFLWTWPQGFWCTISSLVLY